MNHERHLAYLQAMGIQPWRLKNAPPAEIIAEAPCPAAIEVEPVKIIEQPKAQAMTWQQLTSEIQNCQQCPRSKTRQQALLGFGDPQAKLLIIAEPPDQEEDQQNAYFIGDNGTLLNNILLALNLKREQVYITPCLKCAEAEPKKTFERVEPCQNWLKNQIELIRPNCILILGKVACQQVLKADKKEKMLMLRERKETSYLDIPVIISYHPRYLLKRPTQKFHTWADLQGVFNYIV